MIMEGMQRINNIHFFNEHYTGIITMVKY